MKTKSLLFSISVILLGGLLISMSIKNEIWKSDTTKEQAANLDKYYEWILSKKVNQETGIIDPVDVERAEKQVLSLRNQQKFGALNLEWEEYGPN